MLLFCSCVWPFPMALIFFFLSFIAFCRFSIHLGVFSSPGREAQTVDVRLLCCCEPPPLSPLPPPLPPLPPPPCYPSPLSTLPPTTQLCLACFVTIKLFRSLSLFRYIWGFVIITDLNLTCVQRIYRVWLQSLLIYLLWFITLHMDFPGTTSYVLGRYIL